MLVYAAVIPHGDFAVDPSLLPAGQPRAEAEELHRSAQDAARKFQSSEVDTVFFVTPHGISMDVDTAIYLGKKGSGCAHIGRDAGTSGWKMRLANIDIDGSVATELRDALRRHGDKVSGLTSFGGYEHIPLRYGEIIPLSFVMGTTEGDGDDEWVKVGRHIVLEDENEERGDGPQIPSYRPDCVIISLPNRRYKEGSSMVDEMLQLGSDLRHFIETSTSLKDRRIAILVSADLAHTHQASGPYGYSPAAQPFDNACAQWARSLDGPPLLEEGRKLLDKALSCGYLGLVILHGALVLFASKECKDAKASDAWDCQLHSISHPSYYGMMVASYSRN